jgi:hypothetical protein
MINCNAVCLPSLFDTFDQEEVILGWVEHGNKKGRANLTLPLIFGNRTYPYFSTNSTCRFSARPSSVLLGATGACCPALTRVLKEPDDRRIYFLSLSL